MHSEATWLRSGYSRTGGEDDALRKEMIRERSSYEFIAMKVSHQTITVLSCYVLGIQSYKNVPNAMETLVKRSRKTASRDKGRFAEECALFCSFNSIDANGD